MKRLAFSMVVATVLGGCGTHNFKLAPVTVEPIHVTIDVNVHDDADSDDDADDDVTVKR